MAGSQPFRARTLKFGVLWEECARRVEPDAKRLDEQLEGLMWQISRDAEGCWNLRDNLYLIKTDPWPDAPVLRVYFTIENDDLCVLQWVEIADD